MGVGWVGCETTLSGQTKLQLRLGCVELGCFTLSKYCTLALFYYVSYFLFNNSKCKTFISIFIYIVFVPYNSLYIDIRDYIHYVCHIYCLQDYNICCLANKILCIFYVVSFVEHMLIIVNPQLNHI